VRAPSDRALQLCQDRVISVHGTVPAHEDGFRRVKGGYLVGVRGEKSARDAIDVINPRTKISICPSAALPTHNQQSRPLVRISDNSVFCRACKKFFDKILSLVEYEEGEVQCPHSRSKNVEQRWSAFSAITSKKSA
jgi:hypothetical protein